MEDEEVVLLSWWASVFSLRVKIALAEKGIDYNKKEEDLFNKSPILVKYNPVHKKVPVLIHNGKPICESLAIVEYIDEVWTSSPSLLPQDPYQRANARFWAGLTDKIYPCARRVRSGEVGEELEAAKVELVGLLKLLEGELGEKPFFGGESFGYIDVALVPFSCWFHTYETRGGFVLDEECPRLMDWVRRCMERDSVSKALPDPCKVFELNRELIKKLAVQQ
uniref:Glutathione S-transferase n=1 Tax=Dracaena cambodiana TaxID=580341 RepID=A0A173GPJ7_9ASPA|nr:glutathione S-transferase [Dracaena cambodiana]